MGVLGGLILKPTAGDPFKYTNLVSALETITVPATGTNNFTIDWGDGTTPEVVTTSSPSHEYVDADTYQISISGTMTQFAFNNAGSKLNVQSFDQFGSTGLVSVVGFAYGCLNCTLINGDDFDTSAITSFNDFAHDCSSLITFNVGTWDTGAAITLAAFARDCSALLALDIENWDISNVTTISDFVRTCTSLTVLDVSSWNTANFINITAFAFLVNGVTTLDTDAWDTRNITTCGNAFRLMTSLTSSFDEFRWWNRTDDLTSGGTPDPIGSFNDCYTASLSISNYASIPNNWKGL